MALTLYYVDPVGGNDSTGNGTIGTPWKSTQKALNTITQGAGGDQINIKAGGDDVLTATLSLATYGTPTIAKPLIFQGYTSTSGDGGVGGISGNSGNFAILTSSAVGICFESMHLHHTGTAAIVVLTGSSATLVACELDHSTAGTAVQCDKALACYLHDLSTAGLWLRCAVVSSSGASYCRFSGTTSLRFLFVNGHAEANELIFTSASSGDGIGCNGTARIAHNSVYGDGGTGSGINDGGQAGCEFLNNIVEGFSGVGGSNYKSTATLAASAGNRSYNGTTGYNYGAVLFQGTDYADSATNFTSAGTGDLSLKTGSPARGVSYPGTYLGSPTQTSYRSAGALEPQDVGGIPNVCKMIQNIGTY